MRLKRGVVRESCDLCHRRKIKCDRAARIARGHAGCSQCSIRQTVCSVDDSDDIRLRQLRQPSGLPNASRSRDIPVTTQPDSISYSQPFHPANAEALGATPAELTPSYDLFDLNAESILFLDQIFMGDLASADWDGHMPDLGLQLDQPTTTDEVDPAIEGHDETVDSSQNQYYNGKDLWSSCGIDYNTFNAALQAYFRFATLALPVLFAEAFWKDCQAGLGSDALVYAVACRGMPFLSIHNKWSIQQKLALRFKERFFERQQGVNRGTSTRLDDVEALALMAGFPYDEMSSPSPYSHLESLFLSHDSLVLTTLQCRLEGVGSEQACRPTMAAERLTLLFWHVYGLDAFHGLDKKSISRIPEGEPDATNVVPHSNSVGYLDAILGLAVVARRIFHLMCSTSARRQGVDRADVNALYGQIRSWRKDSCPPHLQRFVSEDGELQSRDEAESGGPGHHLKVQRAVLWLLEVNCYMQMENCVDEYGFQASGAVLDDEMAVLQVRHESLRAVQEATRIMRWIRSSKSWRGTTPYFSLPDLSPIIRDICAGLSYWTCASGRSLLERGPVSHLPYRVNPNRERVKQGEEDDGNIRSRAEGYLEVAGGFRDMVALAVSHQDTEALVQRLDEFIASVTRDVQSALQ
ncbi:hypothetical protein K4F52_010055 [Lecanicillium sp. MT-2017a]|nr:hypothetical protein K4F52_010055 [Lecanicillium sp. MT-2017a]